MKKVLGIMVLGLLLVGCAVPIDESSSNFRNTLPSISLGDSKSNVLSKLIPLHAKLFTSELKPAEQFSRNGDSFYIHYQRSSRIPDGRATDDEFTPFIFVNNKLTEIGWITLQPKTFGQAIYNDGDQVTGILEALLEMEQKRTGTYKSNSSSSSSSSGMTCFKSGEEKGGFNKLCRYNCVGNLVTTTIRVTELCPLSIRR